MIGVLSMAKDSILADAIASILRNEIDLDVLRLTHSELGKGDHHSVMIVVDEGNPEHKSIDVADLFRNHGTSLVIMISLNSRSIDIYESYQLVNPEMEQVLHIIREFSKINLKKNPDGDALPKTGRLSFKEVTTLFSSFFLHFLGRKSVNYVTDLIGPGRFSGFDV